MFKINSNTIPSDIPSIPTSTSPKNKKISEAAKKAQAQPQDQTLKKQRKFTVQKEGFDDSCVQSLICCCSCLGLCLESTFYHATIGYIPRRY